MAGKKGRSGRPKGSKTKKRNVGGLQKAEVTRPDALAGSQPGGAGYPAADPFDSIQRELSAAQPQAAAGQPSAEAPAPEKIEAPRALIETLWRGIYGAEDYFARLYLGLDERFKGFSYSDELIAAHVEPSCELARKYIPPDVLKTVTEKTPEIMLAFAFAEGQARFFRNIQAAKREIQQARHSAAPQPTKAAPAASAAPTDAYPTRDQI